MTMMKHPRLKAKTMRMTLGFLILSLWRRPRSRAESWVRGSCEVDAALVVSTLSPTGASIRLADPCGSLSSCTSSAVQCGSRSGDEGKDRKKRARLNTLSAPPRPSHGDRCFSAPLPPHTNWSRLPHWRRSPSGGHRSVCVRGGVV